MSADGMGFRGYPAGAIRTKEQLLDIVIEARREKKAIRLYEVSQGGHLSELFLTSRCRISKSEGLGHPIHMLDYWRRSTFGHSRERYYKTRGALGDLNVRADGRQGGHNRHMLFDNRQHAVNYSDALKTDREYQAAVKAWHAYCSRTHRSFWA